MTTPPGFIPPHGNNQELICYQKSEVVFDLTFRFCQRFLNKGDRTVDQMVQAARSGKQNIVEGSQALGTSSGCKGDKSNNLGFVVELGHRYAASKHVHDIRRRFRHRT